MLLYSDVCTVNIKQCTRQTTSAMVKQLDSLHPTAKKLFAGRKMVISTMHGKHHVIKPLIRQYLNVESIVIPDIDTDIFGTFSGEMERSFDAVTTLRKKILKGLEASGETLGIGNEGSFGAHPHLPFLQVDQEIVMLIDLVNNIEIAAHVVSTETNYFKSEIREMKDLLQFTEKTKFPSHGIIVKQIDQGKVVQIRKGIITWELLYAVTLDFARNGMDVLVETDMRGYMNPTRMKVIERATRQLMKKIITHCPQCHYPGFGVLKHEEGLPCSICQSSTQLPMSKIYQCQHCHYTDTRTINKTADPQYCNFCNP